MFKKIVVAVDGSDCSMGAVRMACEMAQASGGEITIVHAPQAETSAMVVGAVSGYHEILTAPTHDELLAAGQSVLDQATAEAKKAGCTAKTDMHVGDPVRQVLKVAKEEGADLIVTGRRGLGSVASLFLGSTSQRIQHHAACACLTVV